MDDIFLKIKRPEDFQKFLVDLKRNGDQIELMIDDEFELKAEPEKPVKSEVPVIPIPMEEKVLNSQILQIMPFDGYTIDMQTYPHIVVSVKYKNTGKFPWPLGTQLLSKLYQGSKLLCGASDREVWPQEIYTLDI